MQVTGKKISCRRGFKIIFRDLSFSVNDGECLILSGQNGSGKTSLLKILSGFLELETGELSINHDDIHYIGSKHALRNSLSIYENLEFWSNMLEGNKSNIIPALEKFGLGKIKGNQIENLSSGQIKRCSLARLLLANKKIWLLDEPENALDKDFIPEFINIVDNHINNGGIAIIASHRTDLWKNKKIMEISS